MAETTISVVDSHALLSLFGPRDQHLRKIREALAVEISAHEHQVRIAGEQQAVARATEVLEQLKDHLDRHGTPSVDDVERALANVQNGDPDGQPAVIDVFNPNRKVRPRTPGQIRYVNAIRDHDLILAIGPAGTGKTYLAVAMATAALRQEQIRKIVLVRPAVEAGESLGFLPGDLRAKINPYLRPLMDALGEMMDYEQLKKYLETDVVEVIPLAYMRGRTLNEAFIILDEAQNATIGQLKMFLTRMGQNSKIVVSGDTTQVDLPTPSKSGLIDAMRRLKNIKGVASVELQKGDIVRHRLVQDIVRAYEEESSKPRWRVGRAMSTGGRKRTRSERVAALELPPSRAAAGDPYPRERRSLANCDVHRVRRRDLDRSGGLEASLSLPSRLHADPRRRGSNRLRRARGPRSGARNTVQSGSGARQIRPNAGHGRRTPVAMRARRLDCRDAPNADGVSRFFRGGDDARAVGTSGPVSGLPRA